MKTVSCRTFGCKVNQYETDSLLSSLSENGFRIVRHGNPADYYILNTCALTKRAEQKARQYIRKLLQQDQGKVIVTGCYVQRDEKFLKHSFSKALIFNNIEKMQIPVYLEGLNSCCSRKPSTRRRIEVRTRALVKIQDGCASGCSYCIIPYVRNKVISRPFYDIVKEIEGLLKRGYKEIVLTGINMGQYKSGDGGLMELLKKIDSLALLARFRLSSLEPKTFDKDFISGLAGLKKLCPHFHIPLQSGDDRVLALMSRGYTCDEYHGIVLSIRKNIKDVGITTDIMVGFPGEDDRSFLNTCDFINDISFSRMHIFPYSSRPGTPAYIKGYREIPAEIILKRKKVLAVLEKEHRYRFAKGYMGQLRPVLLEHVKNGLRSGFTDNYIRVAVKGGACGMLADVRLIGISEEGCTGEIARG